MFINCGKIISCLLDIQTIEDFITAFFKNAVFHHVCLSFTNESKNQPKFDFQHHYSSWILNGPWYTTTICSKLHGLYFEGDVTTAIKYRCSIMCSIEVMTQLIQLEMRMQVVVVEDQCHPIQNNK